MTETIIPIILIVLNYLGGSISSAVLISKYVKKVDIRKVGYKTAGGSNVVHNIGLKWGLFVGIFDILKGIPVLFLSKYLNVEECWYSFIAIAAVAGHCWPIWFNFSGGRGVATLMGVITFLTPKLAILPIIIFICTLIPSILKKKFSIDFKWISSPTLTLVSIICYIFLTLKSHQAWDIYFSVLLLVVIILRRVTARIGEYRVYNPLKLFFWRLMFDDNYK